MTASTAFRLLPLTIGALAGCATPQPVVMHGDANSVEVSDVGSAPAAGVVARRHCSQFEKIPRFLNTDGETVLFDCVRR